RGPCPGSPAVSRLAHCPRGGPVRPPRRPPRPPLAPTSPSLLPGPHRMVNIRYRLRLHPASPPYHWFILVASPPAAPDNLNSTGHDTKEETKCNTGQVPPP